MNMLEMYGLNYRRDSKCILCIHVTLAMDRSLCEPTFSDAYGKIARRHGVPTDKTSDLSLVDTWRTL